LIGASLALDPPTVFGAGPTLEPTYTVDAAADTFTVSDLGGYDPATDGVIGIYFSVSAPVNPGVNFFAGPFREAGSGTFATLAALPTDEPLPFPVTAGQKLFLRAHPVTPDGRLGVAVVTPFQTA